jgi:O-antigen ligase
MIVILIGSVFFEGAGYSFQLLGMRVRSVQVFEVIFLVFLGMFSLFGKWRWRKSPLDFWLLAYLSINFIAIFNSPWKARSVKIFLLLVSLVLLYWLVYQLLRTMKDIFLAFYIFLAMGTLQVLLGLYQVLAGALNYYRGWRLPIGHLGLVHQEYINSVWGRPYGTQVEPDFYGAFCMAFALIFIILYFSKLSISKQWLLAGTIISMIGLYLSFVRASWFFLLLILILLPFFRRKLLFFKFTWKSAVIIIGIAFGAHTIAVNAVPPIKQIIKFRFATKVTAEMKKSTVHGKGRSIIKKDFSQLNVDNIRLLTMRVSLRTWSEHPVIGSGPGSFAFVFWRYAYNEAGARKRIAEGSLPWTNPNIVFTVLGDTGLLGLALFMVIAWKVVILNLKKNAASGLFLAPEAFALFIGLGSLFLSYMITNGLWLPLTWVFLALNIATLHGSCAKAGGVSPCA